MTTAQQQFAAFTRYLFTTPAWQVSLVLSVVVSLFVGIAALPGERAIVDAGGGLLLVGFPTVATAVVTSVVDDALGGELTLDRSSMLAFACEVALAGMVVATAVVTSLGGLDHRLVVDVFFVALGIAFALRVLIVFSISKLSFGRSILPASIQALSISLALFTLGRGVTSESAPFVGLRKFELLVIVSGLYVASVYAFVRLVDRPVRRALGVTAFGFVHGFVAHLAGRSAELEAFFTELGDRVVAPVTVLSFRRSEECSDGSAEKARFVLPMVHPGPLGEIGGGTLPRRVAEATEGVAFPAHAAVDFDFNLVSQADVAAVVEAAERAMSRITYATAATPSTRTTVGDAKLLGQGFGDGVLLVSTFAPKLTDDIAYGIGVAAVTHARAGGFEDVLFADAHNCNEGVTIEGQKHAPPGSERSFELLSCVDDATNELAATGDGRLRLGVATDSTPWSVEEGIGPLGVRVAVVAVDGQTTAYVLVDGNNMEVGLRERVIESLGSVDVSEVMTTDTHVVNRVNSTRQVGEELPADELVELVRSLVDDALDDLEPVEVGTATECAEVTVFGAGRTETFASHGVGVLMFAAAFAACVGTAVTLLSLLLLVVA